MYKIVNGRIDTDIIDDIQAIQYQSTQWEESIYIKIVGTWYQFSKLTYFNESISSWKAFISDQYPFDDT